MLLNEFLKEHGKVEALDARGRQFQKTIAALQATLKEQTARIEQVSAQVQIRESAARLVSTNK